MTEPRWFERRRVDRWSSTIVFVLLAVVGGPPVISAVTNDPTTGAWLFFAIWLVATVAYAIATIRAWRHRNDPDRPTSYIAAEDDS